MKEPRFDGEMGMREPLVPLEECRKTRVHAVVQDWLLEMTTKRLASLDDSFGSVWFSMILCSFHRKARASPTSEESHKGRLYGNDRNVLMGHMSTTLVPCALFIAIGGV